MNRNRRRFSYITGEKGRNRVRAFEDPRSGLLYLEVRSEGSRKRIALGHRDREAARAKADEVALKLRTDDGLVRHEVTLAELFDNYLREVTPTKGKGKQLHDKRVAAMALEVLGANRIVHQLTHRNAARFVLERRRRGDMRGGERKGTDGSSRPPAPPASRSRGTWRGILVGTDAGGSEAARGARPGVVTPSGGSSLRSSRMPLSGTSKPWEAGRTRWTIVKCYQKADEATMAEALKNRAPLRAVAGR